MNNVVFGDRKDRQFSFIKLPKDLVNQSFSPETEQHLSSLSLEEIVLYSLMIDRNDLSLNNADYHDEHGKPYIVFTVEEISKKIRCSRRKVFLILNRLENCGLIRRVNTIGGASKIYVKDYGIAFTRKETTPSVENDTEKLQSVTNLPDTRAKSAPPPCKICTPPVQNLHPNKTNKQDLITTLYSESAASNSKGYVVENSSYLYYSSVEDSSSIYTHTEEEEGYSITGREEEDSLPQEESLLAKESYPEEEERFTRGEEFDNRGITGQVEESVPQEEEIPVKDGLAKVKESFSREEESGVKESNPFQKERFTREEEPTVKERLSAEERVLQEQGCEEEASLGKVEERFTREEEEVVGDGIVQESLFRGERLNDNGKGAEEGPAVFLGSSKLTQESPLIPKEQNSPKGREYAPRRRARRPAAAPGVKTPVKTPLVSAVRFDSADAVIEGNKKKKTLDDETSAEFKEWWEAYPRHSEKRKAWNRYNTIVKNKEMSTDDLLLSAKMYAYECNRKGTEQEYIKMPATFLSAKNRVFEEYLEMYQTIKAKERQRKQGGLTEVTVNRDGNYTSYGEKVVSYKVTASDKVIPILESGVSSSERYTAVNGVFTAPDGTLWVRIPEYGKTVKAHSLEEIKTLYPELNL